MALDFEAALDQYGFVGVLAKQQPELKDLLARAVSEEWNSARFERELADTPWWKRLNERKRQIAVMKATDPATWTTNLNNKKLEIQGLAGRLGLTLDPAIWAQRALENDWDEATLRVVLLGSREVKKTNANGAMTGELGEIEQHIRQSYAAYGLPISASTVISQAGQVVAGRQTIGGLDNQLRNMAKKQYAQFAEEIDSGMTLRDIADPYIRTMANTLEIADTDITLSDKSIKQALQHVDTTSGKPMVKPLWQFERELKNDPRWQKTNQAKNETYSVLQQLGRDWGFA